MWRGKSVAVILPNYNEKEAIRTAAFDFQQEGLADQVIVVNNVVNDNAAPGTSAKIAGTGVRELFEPKQGYGNALLCGIDHVVAQCNADLIVLAEPNGTLSGHDLLKVLAYSDDVPVVFGTRTSREFIRAGTNMGPLLFHREALQRIRPHLTIGGSHFGPQLLMETIAHGIPFIEIPVNFRHRVGGSSVTGGVWKAFRLGLRMIILVLGYRFGFHRAARVRWNDAGRRQAPVLPAGEAEKAGQEVSRLAQALQRENDPLEHSQQVAIIGSKQTGRGE